MFSSPAIDGRTDVKAGAYSPCPNPMMNTMSSSPDWLIESSMTSTASTKVHAICHAWVPTSRTRRLAVSASDPPMRLNTDSGPS